MRKRNNVTVFCDASLKETCYVIGRGDYLPQFKDLPCTVAIGGQDYPMTVNIAEYMAIIRALSQLVRSTVKYKVYRIVSDSEFAIRQINGQYKTRQVKFKYLREQVRELASRLVDSDVRFAHIPRDMNMAGLVLEERSHR